MKRMTQSERTHKADSCVERLWQDYTCCTGEWNRNKILALVAKKLMARIKKALASQPKQKRRKQKPKKKPIPPPPPEV